MGGKVQIIKGLQSAEEIHDLLTSQDLTKVPVMIHFRIGTHGLKSDPKHTHPFPVGASTEDMERLMHKCDFAVMHNGILRDFGYDKAISDTMAYARDFLGHVAQHLDNPGVKAAVDSTLGWDKLAVMAADGTVRMFGKWIEDGGIFYSNESFRSRDGADPRKWGSCITRWGWDDDLDIVEPEKYRPFRGQLWSDNITIGESTLDDFDAAALRSDASAAVDFGAAPDLPIPDGCSELEYDAWVVLGYLTGNFSEDQFIDYIELGVILSRDLEPTTKGESK